MVKVLAADKHKPKNALEQLLDGVSTATGSSEGSAAGGRRNAAALRGLKKALLESPAYLYKAIECNLKEDFESRAALPGDGAPTQGTIRGWLEHRSRISQPTQVRWAWAVGAIWQALIEEARARCAVLIASADQCAVDGGSWVLGQVAMLEPPRPFSSFNLHRPPGPSELHHSTLLDGRWIEVYLAHVKELDSYPEAPILLK